MKISSNHCWHYLETDQCQEDDRTMKRLNKFFFLFLFLIACNFPSFGAGLSASAKLDSVNLLMGKLTTLHLEVVENKGSNGGFTIFKDVDFQKGYASVCGDSVELRLPSQIDTIELGSGKVQLNYSIPVQAFDSGTYTLPRFVYISGKDTARTNHLTFNVVPVDVTANDPIAGFAPVEEPDGKRWYDWIPDWILDFWWIFLVICLAIIAFLWALRKYGTKTFTSILSKPEPTPWEVALNSLRTLKEKKLWEQGLEKEYFTDLTDILRVYLFKRFGINAMEMTTRQIMDKILESDLKDKKEYIKQILSVADFVKFAKVRPLPADSIAAYENAVKFIEETVPVQEQESEISNGKSEEGGENK